MSSTKKVSVHAFGKAVATVLSQCAEEQKTTQTALATKTGISQSQISKQLRGLRAINVDELVSLCEALNASTVDVIRRAEKMVYPTPVGDLAEQRRKKATPPPHPAEGWRTLPRPDQQHVADTTPPEPGPGDEGYHDGP